MKIPFDKEWLFIEKEDYANYLFVTATWEGYTYMPKSWGFPLGRFLGAEYINSACNLFILKNFNDSNNEINFRNFFVKPYLWDRLHQLTEKNSDRLFFLGKKIKKLNVAKLSNRELIKWINAFQEGQKGVHVPRGPMWLLETPDNIVTNYLHNYLTEKANEKRRKVTKKSYEAFQILTAPLRKSIWTEEKEALAEIDRIKNKKIREKKLKLHAKKFEWLEYGLQGKILSFDYFQKELNKVIKRGAAKVLNNLHQEIELLAKQQRQVIREYGIHSRHVKLFKIVQDSTFTRIYSKYSQFFGYYCIEALLREIGKRSGLTLEQVRFLAPKDYQQALMKKKNFSKITSVRQKYSIHISDHKKTVFYFGHQAKKIRKKLEFFKSELETKKTEVILGQPAFFGKARGRVKIINTVQEMVKMHLGNILVSHMTNPDIVPVMKQAAAIVTDLGGITSHAAIIARELKKPCIIGTKVATKVLRDGDLVFVDANQGVIKRI